MPLRATVLLVPSIAAAIEWPRRLASTGRAVAGLLPFRPLDLARVLAEPGLLGAGLRPWDSGHTALLAARLIAETPTLRPDPALPSRPVAIALARTLSELRAVGVAPARLQALARRPAPTSEDAARLGAVAAVYARYDAEMASFLDPAALYREAACRIADVPWLRSCMVLVASDLDLTGLAGDFVDALHRVAVVRTLQPWCADRAGLRAVSVGETLLAPLAPPPLPRGLAALRDGLFKPAPGRDESDASVELVAAPGEAAEVRSIARRLLRAAAAGVPFEEMGVLLPRPQEYAPLVADLFDRVAIPYRLHPSLPLRFGRIARSLLLLFRCRGLDRARVMEFLTFAPLGLAQSSDAAGEGDEVRNAPPAPSQWDFISREAGIVSGLDRWRIGLEAYAAQQRDEARTLAADAAERRTSRARRAEDLLRIVERLAATLDDLSGEAPWSEWSVRLRRAVEGWLGNERDREAILDVIDDLGGLGSAATRATWSEVEDVVEARFEWERLPVTPSAGGSVHVGVFDAVAGLPFRLVAIPGLVEGGFPGLVRPDPFLLDAEREALNAGDETPRTTARRAKDGSAQLSLFEGEAEDARRSGGPEAVATTHRVPTTQDRLLEARGQFERAIAQATERLILSYPRADPRTGRERMPSLFFAAAASALRGAALSSTELDRLVVEDDLDTLGLDDMIDRSERDRARMRSSGHEAEAVICAGAPHFRHSRDAGKKRWSNELSMYDGLVSPLPADLALKLDPATAPTPISASRLATFSKCGFMYVLQHVLRLQPAEEPEERKRLTPLERGDLFHRVAERFLRGERDEGRLPVKDTQPTRRRLLALADAALRGLVAGSPPRFSLLWERECEDFRRTMLRWLAREAGVGVKASPAYFEVSFGLGPSAEKEPHLEEPLEIDLGDGRLLRVSGRIDRIDRGADGTLVLRDYKTGKAPRDEGGVFRGGRQLQIPFYILAAARLFPEARVASTFLDYVDGGRQVSLDPGVVVAPSFAGLLRGMVDAIASGVFAQEPSACTFCDYTVVCGPQPLLERRKRHKIADPRLQRVLRLRDLG